MREKLEEFLPRKANGARNFYFSKAEQIYRLPNGSRIQVIQQAAGREQFQGARIRAAWIDEECPASQGGEEIFSEILARSKPGQPLDVFYTFTPMNGLDWGYRRLLDEESPDRYPGTEVFYVAIWDAALSNGGYYTDEEIEQKCKQYPEHERVARLEGKATALHGSLYWSRQALEVALKKCEMGQRKRIQRGQATIDLIDDEAAALTVFRPAVSGRQYIVGIDPAGGVGRDRSVAVVIDRSDLAVCAIYSSDRVDPDFFGAEVVRPLGMVYNDALLVVESNNHGGTVISQLRGRSNLWLRQEWSKSDRRYLSEYGWRTDTRTRDRIFDALSRALREEVWTPCDQIVREMMTMAVDKDRKVQALPGYFDDAVMAAGIGYAVHYETPLYQTLSKRRFEANYQGSEEMRWMAS